MQREKRMTSPNLTEGTQRFLVRASTKASTARGITYSASSLRLLFFSIRIDPDAAKPAASQMTPFHNLPLSLPSQITPFTNDPFHYMISNMMQVPTQEGVSGHGAGGTTCNIVEQLVIPREELAVQGNGCRVDAHKGCQEGGAPHSAPHCMTCRPHWIPQSTLQIQHLHQEQ